MCDSNKKCEIAFSGRQLVFHCASDVLQSTQQQQGYQVLYTCLSSYNECWRRPRPSSLADSLQTSKVKNFQRTRSLSRIIGSLANMETRPESTTTEACSSKPPPVYINNLNINTLLKWLKKFLRDLFRHNTFEGKVKLNDYTVNELRKITAYL